LPATSDTPEQIASDLLARFETDIDNAAKIRFLPSGPLDHVDFHALPWKGRRLLAVAPIEYGLDVPGRGSKPTGPRGPAALVIADPSSNLFEAHQEGLVAADWLSGELGFGVQRLDGREATFSSVRRALQNPKVDYLHYAGHGHFSEREEELELPLADGGALTLDDILTLEHTPRSVILSGCETARTASIASAKGLGLAQAFIVRGADVAIAATTEVDDHMTTRIMTNLYRALAISGGEDAASALQTAELEELARTGGSPSNAWSSFRVLVP
jgi:CHAT domain-containing protein